MLHFDARQLDLKTEAIKKTEFFIAERNALNFDTGKFSYKQK
jgi:hypothetical protein